MDQSAVYLDYNATTPLAPEVLDTVVATLRDAWGNPSSSHHAGLKARKCIIEARASVAMMINATPQDIVFTSGGTESNNLVFTSIVTYFKEVMASNSDHVIPHVIITVLEHDSVALTARTMARKGLIELTEVGAASDSGSVPVQSVLAAVRPNTSLVSIMLANNETGVVQPVGEVVEGLKKCAEEKGGRIFVHTDAAQALGKIPVDVEALEVDYATIVGHKFYGPRNGALYVRDLEQKGTPLHPLFHGGGQERGFRSGTENTAMMAGLGKAADLIVHNLALYQAHMANVRDYLEQQLENTFGDRVHFNGRFNTSKRIPNTSNFSIVGRNLKGNRILSTLERTLASVGAACHSHTEARPSPVLLAIGVPPHVALNALRVSVGRETSIEDIDVFIKDLTNAVQKLDSVGDSGSISVGLNQDH
eukprot:Em0005g870a